MGRGQRGKRFRKAVAGIPTAVFRNRLAAQAHRHGIGLFAVNPAYSSVWGDQPPPARDPGNQIPPTLPGKNAATEPGNRYPGTGR
jgi:hypothetical protein